MIDTARAPTMSPKAWRQLPPAYGWDDLVLPAREDEQLRTLAAEFSDRFRDHSGARSTRPPAGKRGVLVLFCGPAGTGKTMAAQALAHELHLGVIEADLTSVLVRERWRMARLFAVAARSGAVLVFDHVDTMIGGVTEADGSGATGAAGDLSELLERSMSHPGIVVFATRFDATADEELLNRFDHLIEFPLPERAAREEIWRRQLAAAGLGEADTSALASACAISGGEIAACCKAAKQSSARAVFPLEVDHLVRALKRDAGSLDRDQPASDAQANRTAPPNTVPTFPSSSSSAAVAAPAPSGGLRLSIGRSAIVALAGVLIAAALGLAVAGSRSNRSPVPALDRGAVAGPVLVSYPLSWHQGAVASLPGLALSHALEIAPADSRLQVLTMGTSPATGATLLPAGLLPGAPKPIVGQLVRLGSMWFYRFPNLSLRGDPRPASVYVLPTTAGRVVSVCRPANNAFTAACERILGALTLRPGVRSIPSSSGYADRLNQVIAKLNAARVTAASKLATARTATAQSQVESKLASAHAQAASLIARLDTGAGGAATAALASSLKMTANAYAAMARAASVHDAVAYRVASSSLAAAAAATGRAFADLQQFGYHAG